MIGLMKRDFVFTQKTCCSYRLLVFWLFPNLEKKERHPRHHACTIGCKLHSF